MNELLEPFRARSVDEHERMAHAALHELRLEYERRAAPYIEILSRIHAMRVPAMVISIDQLQQLQVSVVETAIEP